MNSKTNETEREKLLIWTRLTPAGPLVACALIISIIWSIFYWDLKKDTDNHAEIHTTETIGFASAISQSTLSLFKEVNRVTLLAKQQFLSDRSPEAFNKFVSNMQFLSDFAIQVSFADETGQMVASSVKSAKTGSVSISDREHFRYHLQNGAEDLFIGKPVLGRLSGLVSIQVTRSIRDDQGRLLGVIVVSINRDHLEEFYRRLTPASQFGIALYGTDGTLRASTIASDDQHPIEIASDNSNPTGHDPLRPVVRIDQVHNTTTIASHVPGFPLVLRVSRKLAPPTPFLSGLYRSRAPFALFLTLIICAVTIYIGQRQLESERNRSAELKARESEARAAVLNLKLTLDHMNQGIVLVRQDQTIALCNDRFKVLCAMSPDAPCADMDFNEVTNSHLDFATGHDAAPPTNTPVVIADLTAATFECRSRDGRTLEIQSEKMVAGGWVVTVSDITARQRSEQRIKHVASHDQVTNLANRIVFKDALQDIVDHPSGRKSALLMIDLDRFKSVNDTLGHPSGDKLLQSVSHRLISATRKSDLVARIGGDEFGVLLKDINSYEDALGLGRRIVASLGAPFQIDDAQVMIGASIGIARIPEDGTGIDELMKSADLALYDSKAKGRGQVTSYQVDMRLKIAKRQELEADLRQALKMNELMVYYQPIVDIKTEKIVSFEALLRWNHKTKGFVSPAQFIPLAEECGTIIGLGEWVLHSACREAARWPGTISVSVNLSASQFKSVGLEATILEALSASNLSPSRLILEITESVMMGQYENPLELLKRLRAQGIRVAMDDFGTGYSSLGYLQKYPFDSVKIDGAFVQDISKSEQSRTLLRSIIEMADALGLKTVAECVETEEQLAILRDLGCGQVQGYLIGRPGPSAAIPWTLDEAPAAIVTSPGSAAPRRLSA